MIALLMAFAAPDYQITPHVYYKCTQPRHYDGDDIRCADPVWHSLAGKRGMRIAAIDAPELREEGGRASRDYLRSLTAGAVVQCAWNGTWAAGYGNPRPVVDCRINNVDLACLTVTTGHAQWWPKFDPSEHRRSNCKNLFP